MNVAADLTDPVTDCVRALAVLQTRHQEHGLPHRLEEHRNNLLRELECLEPCVALIVSSWLEAGPDAQFRIEGAHRAVLHSRDGAIRRHWRIDPDTAFVLSPLLA